MCTKVSDARKQREEPPPHPWSHTEGTSDNVLGRVVEGVHAQGGELVPVPQEAPIVLACVHNEPTEQPAPCLLSQGLLHLPLGHIVADVYQLDQEDVGHAPRDDHRAPHAGEAQSRAVICIYSRAIEKRAVKTLLSVQMVSKVSVIPYTEVSRKSKRASINA